MGRRAGDFQPENARSYGAFVGRRYADQPIIWILGGDRPIESEDHRAIIRAMAEGLREGDGGRNLMTFHTWGRTRLGIYPRQRPDANAYLPERP